MPSVIKLAFLLLLAFVHSSADQQDLLCTDSYTEFVSASVDSNISGTLNRNRLYEAFYTPNHHLPYSVLVTFQLVLDNGTRLNLSSDEDCSSELWLWLSSPVFLTTEPTYLNRYILFTLNYFMEWTPPHVIITMTIAPCTGKISDFFNRMISALQDYALGQIENATNLGFVQRGCGTGIFGTRFYSTVEITQKDLISILIACGVFFQIIFIWMVSGVLLKITFKSFAQKTFTYSYDLYGVFWGVSTTALGVLGTVYGIYANTIFVYYSEVKNSSTIVTAHLFIVVLLSPLVLELPVAIYLARKATVAVPCIFRYPATVLCCGRKGRAERLVTTLALWVLLTVLQLMLIHGMLIALIIPVEPFGIATSAMLLVLAFSCFTNIFSLLFTIFAHLFTPPHQRRDSSSMVFRAVVVLPILLAIMCYGVIVTAVESVINMDAKQNHPLSFIGSIAIPILLGVISIFLKRFISGWLKWAPKEREDGTDTAHTQGVDEELLDPQ